LDQMPTYWMISDRTVLTDGFGLERGLLTYWISDKASLENFANWNQVPAADFKNLLIAAADKFPSIPHGEHENQKHVTFLMHGYNNGWKDAARLYEQVCRSLFSGAKGSGYALVSTGLRSAMSCVIIPTALMRVSAP